MKRSHLNKWLADLRSGKYGQVKGYLMNDTCTAGCCLGVYLDGRGLPKHPSSIIRGDNTIEVTEFEYTDADYDERSRELFVLPRSLMMDDGFNNENGGFYDWKQGEFHRVTIEIPGYGEFTSLVEMNDAGVPFPLIADVIQENTHRIFAKPIEDDTIERNA